MAVFVSPAAFAQNPQAARIDALLRPNGSAHDAERDGGVSVQIEREPTTVLKKLAELDQEARTSIDRVFVKVRCGDAVSVGKLRGLTALRSLHVKEGAWERQLADVIGESKTIVEVWAQGVGLAEKDLELMCRAKQLKCLMIENNEIPAAGFAHLADLKQLRQLSISGNDLKTEDVAWLSTMKDLRALWLDGAGIDDRIFDIVAPCKDLSILNLGGTKVTDAGLSRFYESRRPNSQSN